MEVTTFKKCTPLKQTMKSSQFYDNNKISLHINKKTMRAYCQIKNG